MTHALYIARQFPIRGSRNAPSKSTMRLMGTVEELHAEVQALIDADALSYGAITSIRLFVWADMLTDALTAKPVAEFETPAQFVATL